MSVAIVTGSKKSESYMFFDKTTINTRINVNIKKDTEAMPFAQTISDDIGKGTGPCTAVFGKHTVDENIRRCADGRDWQQTPAPSCCSIRCRRV
jgi:hypothetical protein